MIRKATIEDLDAVYDIYMQRYDSHDADAVKYLKSDWEWYLKNDAAIVLVMDMNEAIAGVSFSYNMGLWGYLEHIVIHPEHRNKGYAAALIEHTVSIGKDLGWGVFEACYYEDTDDMAEFFVRSGWKDSGIVTRWVYRHIL